MRTALIVTATPVAAKYFDKMLRAIDVHAVTVVATCLEARRLFIDCDFDVCIINMPLPDETGEKLSIFLAENEGTQVILLVRREHFDRVSEHVESFGVITVSKPLNQDMFWSALKTAKAVYYKIAAIKKTKLKLQESFDDTKTINLAKCVLIEKLRYTEEEAHRFIEKQAMDMRVSKREAADGILKFYDVTVR